MVKQTTIRRLLYHIRHRYLTLNNVVIAVAFLIAAGWSWGAVQVMQRNYGLQKNVDDKQRQLQLVELQNANLEFEKRYYQSDEYKKLAVRERLGLADPGEKVLILPPNSPGTISADKQAATQPDADKVAPQQGADDGNFEQWLNFLLGGARKSLSR